MRQNTLLAVILLGAAPALAQVGHKCVSGCEAPPPPDTPPPSTSPNSSSGPSPMEQQMQQQMSDMAGQLGAAIGLAIGRALSGEADREKAQGFNNGALAAASRGDWKKARTLTRQALQLVPDDPTLKANLSLIQRQIAETERLEAARAQDENLRRQEAERQADARRREEIAQRLSGTLRLSGEAATRDAGNPVGLRLGAETEPDADLRREGTAFFGVGGGPRTHAEPVSDASAGDSTIAASGNALALGGAGIRQGAPDKSPAPNPTRRTTVASASRPDDSDRPALRLGEPAVELPAGATVASVGDSGAATEARKAAGKAVGANLRSQVATLDCGMAEVFDIANALGPEGREFAGKLKEAVLDAERQLPRVPPDVAPKGCDVISLSHDSSSQLVHEKDGTQFIVSAHVTRYWDTGQARVDILYQLSTAGKATRYGQDVIELNASGVVDCQEVTRATAQCLQRSKLAASSRNDYCPRPPARRDCGRASAATKAAKGSR